MDMRSKQKKTSPLGISPTARIRIDEENADYQNQVAVDFYNTDFTGKNSDKRMQDFWEKYSVGPGLDSYIGVSEAFVELVSSAKEHLTAGKVTTQEQLLLSQVRIDANTILAHLKELDQIQDQWLQQMSILIRDEQPRFKSIADQMIEGAKLSEKELSHIHRQMYGSTLYQAKTEDGRWAIHRNVYYGASGILRGLYEWIFYVSQGLREVQRCELAGCNNIYMVRPSGKPGKYCSGACKAKAYRTRKKAMAAQP